MWHATGEDVCRALEVFRDRPEAGAFSFRVRGIPFVPSSTEKTAEGGRFGAAHEPGHLVLHGEEQLPPGPQAEAEAHRFAAALLMPRADVLAHAPCEHRRDPSGRAPLEGRCHGSGPSAARARPDRRPAVPNSLRGTRTPRLPQARAPQWRDPRDLPAAGQGVYGLVVTTWAGGGDTVPARPVDPPGPCSANRAGGGSARVMWEGLRHRADAAAIPTAGLGRGPDVWQPLWP
ncbi:ImmA/IrrE family metallo-endopeptidase [Streptomyces sp. NPDC006134]|uniref:ImmA/IrrE family metallo-endopeptidase n=1 Tax=Streptomyces sp. NPDC006134 TaxID=3154467 RepID=UPI0033FD55F0